MLSIVLGGVAGSAVFSGIVTLRRIKMPDGFPAVPDWFYVVFIFIAVAVIYGLMRRFGLGKNDSDTVPLKSLIYIYLPVLVLFFIIRFNIYSISQYDQEILLVVSSVSAGLFIQLPASKLKLVPGFLIPVITSEAFCLLTCFLMRGAGHGWNFYNIYTYGLSNLNLIIISVALGTIFLTIINKLQKPYFIDLQ